MLPYYIICALAGYLIGSIPFGYIIVKLAKGIDIRTVGSGNIGATNVGRVLGWPAGIGCFLLDMSKGISATLLPTIITKLTVISTESGPGDTEITLGMIFFLFGGLTGLFAIIGHLYPVYLKFRGGKGVATALGVFIICSFYPTIIALVIWLVVFFALRYISLASIIAAFSFPFAIYYHYYDLLSLLGFCFGFYTPFKFSELIWYILYLIIPILIIVRHIPNIKRLIAGTEPKINFRRRKDDKTLNH
jgi:glycerol-3-phosphate acyltransferase PlsY